VNEAFLAPLSEAGIPVQTDYRRLLEGTEADCAVVSLPHYLYPEVVNAALRAGLHVLKEKPFARTLGDARAMREAARETGKLLMVAGQAKHYPSFKRAKALLGEGACGKLLVCRGIITYQWGGALTGNWSWRGEHAKSGGVAVIDSGWHILDLVHWYCGEPTRVSCFLGQGRALPGNYDVDDRAALIIEFGSGAVADVTCCFITQPSNRQVVLHGLDGAIDVTGDRLTHCDRDGQPRVEKFAESSHSLEPQLEAFIGAVRSGVAPASASEEAYQVQRIIDAAYRSADSGRAETLEA
jgi:predicted dehydrogenase